MKKKMGSVEGKIEEDPNGGFYVRSERFDIDATFPTILNNELKDTLQIEVSKMLFN